MQNIRSMQASDLPQVMRIEALTFSNPWPEDAFESSSFLDSYVICEDDILVGYVMYHNVIDESMMINFAVDPAYQKKGYGTALLKYTLDLLIEKKFRNFYLDVRASNLSAQSLYQKFGFKPVGRRKDYYTLPDEDAIVMAMSIGER